MKQQFHSSMYWEQIKPNQSRININLNLSLNEILMKGSALAELSSNRQNLRKRIFDLVEREVVNSIIADSQQPTNVSGPARVEHNIKDKTSLNIRAQKPHNPFQSAPSVNVPISTDSRHQIELLLTSDQPMGPIAALNIAKSHLAMSITDGVINNLSNIYLGEKDHYHNYRISDYRE